MQLSKNAKIVVPVVAVPAAAAFLIGPRSDKPATTSPVVVAASGADTIEILDPVHDRPFEVSTWAPTGNDKHTLVVISHGFSGDRTSHDYLAASLAADGFTVTAPTHPDLAGLQSNDDQLDPLVLRPRHLALTIDHMTAEASQPFDKVVVIGHSMGGYGALRLAGASPSGEHVESHCEANPTDDVLCTPAARSRIDQLVSDATDFAGSRVDTIILLAPAYGPLFSAVDLDQIEASALVIVASADDQLPSEQSGALLQSMPAGTKPVTVDGGHYVFLRTCSPSERASLAEFCTDGPAVDRQSVHAEVVSEIEKFLNR